MASVTTIIPSHTTLTDRSVTITTGGTAQQAAPAKPNRVHLLIQNPTANTTACWFSTIATAVAGSPSVEIPAGQTYVASDGFCPTGALSVIHATTGAKLTIREA